MNETCSAVPDLFLWLTPAYSQNGSTSDWNADLDFLAKELPEKHYDLFTVRTREDLTAGLEKIKAARKGLTDFQTALRLQQLIASFGDTHTGVDLYGLTDDERALPLGLYWFSDGIYILKTTPENGAILGHRIVAINDYAIETVADSLSTLMAIDNRAVLQSIVPLYLPRLEILDAFGFTSLDGATLTLADPQGRIKTAFVGPSPMDRENLLSLRTDSVAFCHIHETDFFAARYFPDDGIYYIQYNKCWGREMEQLYERAERASGMPSFDEFEAGVFRGLESSCPDKIILDLRFNQGGSSAQGTRFVQGLALYLQERPSVRFYVVLGRATFSSAILNAMDCRELTPAIFVGEATAGKPNHFGEVRSFTLPVSGLKVAYSTKYFEWSAENPETLRPDVELPLCFPDFMKGTDPVYEWVAAQ